MSIPDIVLIVSVVAFVSSLIATLASSFIFSAAPAEAIVFHQMVLAEDRVQANDELHLTFSYDKRDECNGEGARGEYYFRVWYGDGDASNLRRLPDGRSANADPAGLNQQTNLVVRLSHIFPPLQPGRYELQVVGAFKCRGEVQQFNPSPRVPFTVTG